MYVTYDRGDKRDLAMICFYEDPTRQSEMMHNLDIDKQVKEWQRTNTGNPPRFSSRIKIKEFTNRQLRFSKLK